jgi:hypothetical protein
MCRPYCYMVICDQEIRFWFEKYKNLDNANNIFFDLEDKRLSNLYMFGQWQYIGLKIFF